MPFMTIRTKNYTREPAKTKVELREMLAEAIRNTKPELLHPDPPRTSRKIPG